MNKKEETVYLFETKGDTRVYGSIAKLLEVEKPKKDGAILTNWKLYYILSKSSGELKEYIGKNYKIIERKIKRSKHDSNKKN
jgi:hypothetical protein